MPYLQRKYIANGTRMEGNYCSRVNDFLLLPYQPKQNKLVLMAFRFIIKKDFAEWGGGMSCTLFLIYCKKCVVKSTGVHYFYLPKQKTCQIFYLSFLVNFIADICLVRYLQNFCQKFSRSCIVCIAHINSVTIYAILLRF